MQVSDLKLEREALNGKMAQLKKRYFSHQQKQRRQQQLALELGMGFDPQQMGIGAPPQSLDTADGSIAQQVAGAMGEVAGAPCDETADGDGEGGAPAGSMGGTKTFKGGVP